MNEKTSTHSMHSMQKNTEARLRSDLIQGETGLWQAVLGLEIHIQLATKSKIFSSASTAYGADPNTQANFVDVALPGTLPVLNGEAVRLAIRFGLAVDAHIAPRSIFARKNYFYPDSPKGYQISQYELPIIVGGTMPVRREDGSIFEVALTRAHLEEDAGKSVHDAFHAASGIDLNRAGTPLLELVSEPVMHSASDAADYMRAVHQLVCWLGICDGNLQEGSFRCDANVSVRRADSHSLGTRAEIKNVNSFRFVEKAIEYEIERQVRVLESNGTVIQETRLYDSAKHQTRSMRSKESAMDYRYFPDPDLPPLMVSESEIFAIRASLPERPMQRRERYIVDLGLSDYDANMLTQNRQVSDYFEVMIGVLPKEPKLCANWVLGELSAALNEYQVEIGASKIAPLDLANLLVHIQSGEINGKTAKQVFSAMWQGEGNAAEIIASRGLGQISDTGALRTEVEMVLRQFPAQVADFNSGNEKILQFLVGQVMKATRGKANPQQLHQLLIDILKS